MKHSIVFRNRDNHWDNALPLGNGSFGAMPYFEEHELHLPMNHYEVYSYTRKTIIPSRNYEFQKNMTLPAGFQNGSAHREYYEKAQSNIPKGEEAFCEYRLHAKEVVEEEPYWMAPFATSSPATGTLLFRFADALKDAEEKLVLSTEDAAVTLDLKTADKALSMETLIAREDCILQRIRQSENGLLQSVRISMDPERGSLQQETVWQQISDSVFGYSVHWTPAGCEEPFHFSGVLRLLGASGILEHDTIRITDAEPEFTLMTGIFTQWNFDDPLQAGIDLTARWSEDLPGMYARHKTYWDAFFCRSSICIPDKFLENAYYVNQYALDCCSGKDGIMKHNACGLNGLWDVHRPTLWASVWYWDVNIQASYAGVFTSNRLDQAKVFSDGLLCYKELAELYARRTHDLPGAAIDYPYQNYYSVWPWCAQYLWFLYEYSLDEEYLRRDAYPLFLKLCEFAVNLFQYDAETDTYTVYPDISPEQGPLAHNTTITVASVKYMLQFTLKAAEILGDDNPLLADIRRVLEKLPPYAISKGGYYGPHLKDSPDAPDEMFVRHPSLLMPLFPIGEYDPASCDQETYEMLVNTVEFLTENAEIGIFGGSWIAASAARLGMGQMALRMIYERGLDHMLRSNGLTAEATDRFMNFCLVTRQPLYYPCMMEFTGEMLAAVNELLLQSYNDLIRVFPAVPDGSRFWKLFNRAGYRLEEYQDRHVEYPAWKDVRFDTLLAKGAFEISAQLKDGQLDWIQVHSQKGGTARITCPFMQEALPVFCGGQAVDAKFENGILTFHTEAEQTYLVAASADTDTTPAVPKPQPELLTHQSYTKRRIFLGENEDVGYYKAVDSFLRDWYVGNVRMNNHTQYKFDFGVSQAEKVYTKSLTRQVYVDHGRTLRSMPFIFIDPQTPAYDIRQGYGFSSMEGITACKRDLDDCLRQDFLQGETDTEFLIEVPRGQYELLVISGDQEEASVTKLEGSHGFQAGGEVVKAGRWQCELVPMIQKKDGPMRLKISTKPGYRWKINCIFLNVIKGYF